MSEEVLISTFTKLRRRFLQLANRFLSDEEDANDALQDAFCRLWPRRDSIRTCQEAEALTVTTVRNLCIDKVRRRKLPTVELESEGLGGSSEDCEEEREELFREVERLIESELTPLQQLILRRKEYEGVTLETIARELGMQPAAVRMQLSRARKTIRECYKQAHRYEN